jgi:hypothetical protein
MPRVRVVLNRKVEDEIGGLVGAAATGKNARRNDQATEEGQTEPTGYLRFTDRT